MEQTSQPVESTVESARLIALQQELVETQRELLKTQKQVIALQKKLEKKMPKNPKDKDIFWHLASDGVRSIEAANSDDLLTLKQFYEWNLNFARKHIRPYVNPKVFGECLNQMTRGLGERISALETKQELQSRGYGYSLSISQRVAKS